MAINQITKVRMPDGSEVALTDWSARPLYSTGDFWNNFNMNELRVFTYAPSERVATTLPAGARVASLRDTNITSSSEMDSTEEFLVYAIKIEMHLFGVDQQGHLIIQGNPGLPVPTAPIMSYFQNKMIGELEVSEKAFLQAGVGWFNQGFGPSLSVASGNTLRTYANQGNQTHEATEQMPIPVHIGGTEDYSFIFHNPDADTVSFTQDSGDLFDDAVVLQCRTYLCGLHKRPMA